MQYLIIDTSSIVFALSNNVDIFQMVKDELPGTTILISNGIVNELKGIAKKRGKNGKYASVAISLLNSHNNIRIEQNKGYVDSWILMESRQLPCSVCTNDTKLKKALRQNKIKVYSISRNGTLR
jgi:rRNA-processing protein FCF1